MQKMESSFYFGDNLHIVRDYIADESVDLIYLDPPFNSNATYNLLFRSPDRNRWSDAQIATFEDSWSWGELADAQYRELTRSSSRVADVVGALHRLLGPSDMLAYLVMMAARLAELHRALKQTGSLYLHCDPTASHYLKVLLDGIFGAQNFRNEVIWRRTNAHNVKSKMFPRVHDSILFVTKSDKYTWNKTYMEYSPEQLSRYKTDERGRVYTGQDLTMIGGSADRKVSWRGATPPPHRSWGASIEQLEEWWAAGLILTKRDGTPRLDGRKVFLDEKPGKQADSLWTDIQRIGNTAGERLGYPTQKPVALLERIIAASSNPGDVVLDPFCGCGTTLHAAHGLDRRWIGIDVSVQAMTVVGDRLNHNFPGIAYDVFGVPTTLDGAHWLAAADPFKFEEWAVNRIGAMHSGRYRGDGGIDGTFFFLADRTTDSRGIVSVKAGRNLNPGMVRDLAGTLQRERDRTDDPSAVAVLICAHEPTEGMRREALAAGTVETFIGPVPALQILSINDVLEGKTVRVPAMYDSLSAAAGGRRRGKGRTGYSDPTEIARQRQMLLSIPGSSRPASRQRDEVMPESIRKVG